jgi:hypothetical protein
MELQPSKTGGTCKSSVKGNAKVGEKSLPIRVQSEWPKEQVGRGENQNEEEQGNILRWVGMEEIRGRLPAINRRR